MTIYDQRVFLSFPLMGSTVFIVCSNPVNERWHYSVTPSLIGWAYRQNDPWKHICFLYQFARLWMEEPHCFDFERTFIVNGFFMWSDYSNVLDTKRSLFEICSISCTQTRGRTVLNKYDLESHSRLTEFISLIQIVKILLIFWHPCMNIFNRE